MKFLLASTLFAALVGPAAGQTAMNYRFCAVSQGHETSYENCGFSSWEQCQEELKGMRGYCRANPYYDHAKGRRAHESAPETRGSAQPQAR
jgi:hypothetical protein